MEQTEIPKTRVRVNFSVSVKGIVTPDCTFEAENMDRTKVLVEATKLLDEAMMVAKERSTKLY